MSHEYRAHYPFNREIKDEQLWEEDRREQEWLARGTCAQKLREQGEATEELETEWP